MISFKSKGISIIAGVVLLALIATISGLLSIDKPRLKLRETILADAFFNSPVPITITDPKDSVAIEVVRVDSYDKLVHIDTLPLNSMWVRIRVSNFSDSLNFVPDSFFYAPVFQERFDGILLSGGENISSQENIQLTLPHDPGRVFEWKVINEPLIRIPPKSAVFSLIKLVAHQDSEDQIASFTLGISGFLLTSSVRNESNQLKLAIDR